MSRFPFYLQTDAMACGATCLKMVAEYHGRKYEVNQLAELTGTTRLGVSVLGISSAAQTIGFETLGIKLSHERFNESLPLPAVAHWAQKHFVVIHKITDRNVHVADPAIGLLTYTKDEFLREWKNPNSGEGTLLLLEPTDKFYNATTAAPNQAVSDLSFFIRYFRKHRQGFYQLFLGLILGLMLQLFFPLLTQALVDNGIKTKDIGFVNLILIAQLVVFLGRITVDIIRSFVLMHISNRINMSLVADFFQKLMRLPISFFDVRMAGDIMQRINDNRRIEQFLTGSSLGTIFSVFSFVIFSAILALYNVMIFAVFMTGTVLYFLWISIFLKRRAKIDNQRFSQSAQNQTLIMELINGMQEIKLHNAESKKLNEWESSQFKIYDINLKALSLGTIQNSGSILINELKNILTTFLSVKLVIDDKVTLGMMFSISYIIGQLNSPVSEMVNFVQRLQDARLSLRRLKEIHEKEDEQTDNPSDVLPGGSIVVSRLSFKYPGIGNDNVLNDINATIPDKKITAIVGTSGSGKTTLMKLLLKYYRPSGGQIRIGDKNMSETDTRRWRDNVGVVLQEGYIFNDTIASNIALGRALDDERLRYAAHIANILDFIVSMPNAFETKIGSDGVGLSTGQKQRILIARAVYKDPDYLFFDEATSALDARNEKVIMENLYTFFKDRTVIIIAHRLSTVKFADQILVLENGSIIESGNHQELTDLKKTYYHLVKNQLELGQ